MGGWLILEFMSSSSGQGFQGYAWEFKLFTVRPESVRKRGLFLLDAIGTDLFEHLNAPIFLFDL